MRPQLRAYLLAMAAPAVAVTLLLLWLPPAPPGDPWLAALLVALGALAANFPVMVSPRYKADAAPAIYIALVLIFPAALAVALVGLIRLVGEGVLCVRRNPFEIWVEAAAADFKQTAALYVAGFLLAVLSNGQTWLALAMMVPVAGIQLALSRSVQLMEQTIAAVESMADVVDRRDPYTFQHSQSVANHSVSIARKLRLPDREVELIRLAARVHDLGKIAVPDEVLHKQGRLTSTEFELMKKHPETGVEILSKFPEYKRGRELVLAHHERMDGLGYPRGIAGPAIALGARIIAVADSWDAMTSNRPYRTALDHDVALAELYRGRGTQWDPAVVDAFANTLPGASPEVRQGRFAEVGRPLLRSLGAAVGAFAGN